MAFIKEGRLTQLTHYKIIPIDLCSNQGSEVKIKDGKTGINGFLHKKEEPP